ncbi:MAG: NAD(P)-binding domain-containing protein, partial [Anaerolineae bacterium]
MNDLKGTTLSFIGTGVMAEAMIKAILDKGLIEVQRIVGSGPRPERAQELES